MGGCNITTEQSRNDVNPHIKKLSKEIAEKYIYELVKEATKRAIEDQAEKIDEKKIQKLQQKITELSDDQKTNLFKGSEDEISKIIHQKDLNSEKIIEKINTTFKKTLDLNARSLLPRIILPISTKSLLIIIAVTGVAIFAIPLVDYIINPDDPQPLLSPPTIHYFIAEPEFITGTQGITELSWEISDATSITIDEIGPVEPSTGSIETEISETTTFTLTATNEAGLSDDESVTVTVEDIEDQSPELSIDPDPLSFNFDTMNEGDTDSRIFSISNAGSGTLEWSITSIHPWIEVSPNTGTDSGTVSIIVNSAGMDPGRHNGRITVESNGGNETGRISVYISDPGQIEEPVIHYFRANPEHVEEGQTTLSWEISGATSVTIDGIGPVEASMGSIQRQISQNTTFTIRATNDAGTSDDEVTVTIEVPPPELSINPDPLDFNFGTMVEGNIDDRTFSISNTGSGTLGWDISNNQPWITVSPTSGINSGEVIVTVNTAQLGPGDYSGTITIRSNGGEPEQGSIRFTIKEMSPILSVNPDPLVLNFNIGPINLNDAFFDTFDISNIGDGTLEWKISTKQDWINVDPSEGINSEEVTIRVKTANLDAGSYDGEIFIDSNGGKKYIPVSLIIESSIPDAPSRLNKFDDYPCEIKWMDNSDNEDGFNIYIGYSCVSCDEISEWKQVASVGKGVTDYSWSESCCSVAECSCVMVRAYNEIGESSNSNLIILAPLC